MADGKLDQYRGELVSNAIDEAAAELDAAANDVRIDGSDRARRIADRVTAALSMYLAELTAEEQADPERIRALCVELAQAEDDMVDAARADFGAESYRGQPGR